VGSIPSNSNNFSTLDCKKYQQGTLSQGNINLQLPLWDVFNGTGIGCPLTLNESTLHKIIIIGLLGLKGSRDDSCLNLCECEDVPSTFQKCQSYE